MGFMDLEKTYDKVNREALWHVLRIYDVGSKLLNGIKSIHINSLACVRVKKRVIDCFGIEIGMRQGFILSPWLFNVHMDAVMKEEKMEMGRIGVRFLEEESEWKLPGLLYADMVLCSKSEENLRVMVGILLRCIGEGFKINADKSKVMMLGRKVGLEFLIHVDGV